MIMLASDKVCEKPYEEEEDEGEEEEEGREGENMRGQKREEGVDSRPTLDGVKEDDEGAEGECNESYDGDGDGHENGVDLLAQAEAEGTSSLGVR